MHPDLTGARHSGVMSRPTEVRILEETIMVKAIPEGYHSITAYLSIDGASDAIDFYKRAFGATEVMRMPKPDGKVGHAELAIGDSKIIPADEYPEMGYRSPLSIGGAGVSMKESGK